jgi:hypothetical protein
VTGCSNVAALRSMSAYKYHGLNMRPCGWVFSSTRAGVRALHIRLDSARQAQRPDSLGGEGMDVRPISCHELTFEIDVFVYRVFLGRIGTWRSHFMSIRLEKEYTIDAIWR